MELFLQLDFSEFPKINHKMDFRENGILFQLSFGVKIENLKRQC